jgi:hypothetical protein
MTMNNKKIAGALIAGAIALSLGACAKQDDARVAQLETRLARAEARIGLTEDYNQLANLQRQYGYYLDKAQYSQIIDLFTDDVSLEYSHRGVYKGKEHAVKLMSLMPGGKTGLLHGMLQNHIQIGGVIHVAEDGKTAKARWRALIMMGNTDKKTADWQEGIYENEYRKENGVWKISKIVVSMNVAAKYDKGWGVAPEAMPGVNKDNPPDAPQSDPNYVEYPGIYVPPYHYPNPVTGKAWTPPAAVPAAVPVSAAK